jgi:hypothetical protein
MNRLTCQHHSGRFLVMSSSDPSQTEAKTIRFPTALWAAVSDYQRKRGLPTQTMALRELAETALATHSKATAA